MPLIVTSPMYEERSKMKSFRRTADKAWERFLETGRSNHSASAMLLPVIMNLCDRGSIPYTLRALPGAGYYIERDVEMEKSMAALKDKLTR